jgi:hypothetical protein
MRILGYVIADACRRQLKLNKSVGWAKYMEWNYPVEVVVTSKKAFKLAGAVEAAASL